MFGIITASVSTYFRKITAGEAADWPLRTSVIQTVYIIKLPSCRPVLLSPSLRNELRMMAMTSDQVQLVSKRGLLQL